MPQRAAQRGKLEVMRPQEMQKLAAAGLGEASRRQVAAGVDLHARHSHALDLMQPRPERQTERIETDGQLQAFHGSEGTLVISAGRLARE